MSAAPGQLLPPLSPEESDLLREDIRQVSSHSIGELSGNRRGGPSDARGRPPVSVQVAQTTVPNGRMPPVKARRKLLGLSPAEVGRQLGFSESAISRMERGERTPAGSLVADASRRPGPPRAG